MGASLKNTFVSSICTALNPRLASFDARGRRVRFPKAPPQPGPSDSGNDALSASADYLDRVAEYESEVRLRACLLAAFLLELVMVVLIA